MIKITEFKGHKVLVLSDEKMFPFSFGINKAKLILENIEEIKKFVKENE